MKKVQLIVAMLMTMVSLGFSQQPKFGEDKMDPSDDKYKRVLVSSFKKAGLTDDQITKAVSIVDKKNTIVGDLQKDKSIGSKERSQKNREATDDMKEALQRLMGNKLYYKWTLIRKNKGNSQ